jgi:carbamoyltransferase
MSRTVLGISDDYTANVAVLAGTEPVFAAANDRFTRHKGDAGFPDEALAAALAHAGLSLADIDEVVVANRTHFVYRLLRKSFEGYDHDFFSLEQKAYLRYHDLVWHAPAFRASVHAFNGSLLSWKLGRRVRLCDHHMAHCCAALATSGFDRCLVVSVDNLGDGASAKVYSWDGRRMRYLQGSRASDSPGQFYGEITQLLGYNPLRHAGKVTGLAAHGDPEPAYGIMRRLISLSDDGRRFVMMPSWARWAERGPCWRLSLFSPQDVAAAAQRRLEVVVSRFVQRAVERSGHDRLALAGGVVANVRLNQVLRRLPGVRAIHVHPAMSDEGLALGAAAWGLLRRGQLEPRRLDSPFLGPGFSEDELCVRLDEAGLGVTRPRDLPRTVAALLAAGHSVARYAGRLEYGPRALGNRSILLRPDDPTVMVWLNDMLRRTEFMPFAPVVRCEDGPRCFEGLEGCEDPARFMTVALGCTPWFQARCPGVVHVDGTARPQLINRRENPVYHDILTRFQELTGLPALLNTSFNMHEEPIVTSPADAVGAFTAAGLDFLSTDQHVAWNPQRPELRKVLFDACAGD